MLWYFLFEPGIFAEQPSLAVVVSVILEPDCLMPDMKLLTSIKALSMDLEMVAAKLRWSLSTCRRFAGRWLFCLDIMYKVCRVGQKAVSYCGTPDGACLYDVTPIDNA